VAIAWIGFDQPRKLGNNETGGVAALPIWMGYMGKVLHGVEEQFMPVPEGVTSASINPDNGLADKNGKMSDYFYRENVPREEKSESLDGTRSPEEVKSQLF
jgi:penicillin-binding protein 1A